MSKGRALFAHRELLGFQVVGIVHDLAAKPQGEEADGNVDVKDPAPAIVVGDVTAERRPDDGREQRGDAEHRLGGALLLRRKRVEQHALARGLQAAAGETLQHAGARSACPRLVAIPQSTEARVKTAIESRK